MSLQSGLDAAKQGRYREAVPLLEQFCRNCADYSSSEYLTAQMWLLRAYQGTGKIEKAIILCQKLMISENLQARSWAEKMRPTLSNTSAPQSNAIQKTGRAATASVKLAMGGVGGSLTLASGVTITLLFGMVLALGLSLVLILGSNNPQIGLLTAIGFTLVFNLAAFFLSPFLMDLTQRWLLP